MEGEWGVRVGTGRSGRPPPARRPEPGRPRGQGASLRARVSWPADAQRPPLPPRTPLRAPGPPPSATPQCPPAPRTRASPDPRPSAPAAPPAPLAPRFRAPPCGPDPGPSPADGAPSPLAPHPSAPAAPRAPPAGRGLFRLPAPPPPPRSWPLPRGPRGSCRDAAGPRRGGPAPARREGGP